MVLEPQERYREVEIRNEHDEHHDPVGSHILDGRPAPHPVVEHPGSESQQQWNQCQAGNTKIPVKGPECRIGVVSAHKVGGSIKTEVVANPCIQYESSDCTYRGRITQF